MSAPLELSVVVPARDAAGFLPDTLGALRQSDLPREAWELIVVDDGSLDRTAEIAARHADTVVRLPAPARGPSYARNRGAEAASGEWLLFVDADVRVHPGTLRGFAEAIRREPGVDAVFGSYDDRPPADGAASRYRNLLHHYIHQRGGARDAESFWAGLGAIRRAVFFEAGMYDEWHFPRPQIEDIELGRRLRALGHRIRLYPEIQATHLKRWTLAGMVRNDFRDRGVPWMRLIAHEGRGWETGLNVGPGERRCAALTSVSAMCVAAAPFVSPWLLAISLGALGLVLATNARFYALLARRGGPRTLAVGVPLHLLYYLNSCAAAVTGWLAYSVVGPPLPPLAAAVMSELGVEADPPFARPPARSTWYHRPPAADGRRQWRRPRRRRRGSGA